MGGALRGLAQLLPFVAWSLHQRGCRIAPPIGTTEKISVSPIAFAHSNPIPLHSCKLRFTFCCSYTLAMLAWNVLWMFKLVLKLHLNLKKLKTTTFLCWGSNHPPLDTSSRSFQLLSEHWSPLIWFNHHWRKMDESTIGSIRHRVPILDREFYSAWKNEML